MEAIQISVQLQFIGMGVGHTTDHLDFIYLVSVESSLRCLVPHDGRICCFKHFHFQNKHDS